MHFLLRILAVGLLWCMPGISGKLLAGPGTLEGTVMTGYQGWFAAEGDGTGMGWHHYGFGKQGVCQIDLWPDLTEFTPEEQFPTPLRMADGSPARVFSSAHPATVQRHFGWMRAHGIDGVFLQRFGVSLRGGKHRDFVNQVMENVRRSAAATGRTWSVMYDLSGMNGGSVVRTIRDDWTRLREELKVTADKSYQHHLGKPVVAVWGIGFNDNRAYSLAECAELLRFLREEAGGACVMAGVPFGWRTLTRDAISDPLLLEVLEKHADIISPWSVGRYGRLEDARHQIAEVQKADAKWCHDRGKSCLPVIFPGFSWHNLMKSRGQSAPVNMIPRLKGQFYWEQAMTRIREGADMLYVAMFDEMDEATAIFKIAATVPAGDHLFVTPEGEPPDHYLWLTSQIRKVLRGELAISDSPPARD